MLPDISQLPETVLRAMMLREQADKVEHIAV